MFLLSDIITYIRRIIKTPSNAVISDNLLIDYINRFWITDVDARIQVFDLKTKYQFQTTPGVDKYNMPLYNIQVAGAQSINMYPVYQGFISAAKINGVQVPIETQKSLFESRFPNIVQYMTVVGTGDGTTGPYTLNFPIGPGNPQIPLNPPVNSVLRGHIDITGIANTGANVDPPVAQNAAEVSNLLSVIPTTSIDTAVFLTATDEDGSNIVIQDSGIFLQGSINYGLLIYPGNAPFGHTAALNGYTNLFIITGVTQATQAVVTANNSLVAGQTVYLENVVGMVELNGNTYTVVSATSTTVTLDVNSTGFTPYVSGGSISVLNNVINYLTGVASNVFFPRAVPAGANINVQCYYFQTGLPRQILFYNNTLTLRSPPAMQYLVELDSYLSPAAFLSTSQSVPFGYMSEYIARGAARKILSDTGDVEQFQFYEPLFREQELLVWKRSQRQWTNNRTQTIYSQGNYSNSGMGMGSYGSGV